MVSLVTVPSLSHFPKLCPISQAIRVNCFLYYNLKLQHYTNEAGEKAWSVKMPVMQAWVAGVAVPGCTFKKHKKATRQNETKQRKKKWTQLHPCSWFWKDKDEDPVSSLVPEKPCLNPMSTSSLHLCNTGLQTTVNV